MKILNNIFMERSLFSLDGDMDCSNGSDELNCTSTTSPDSNHKTENIMPTCHDWMFQCSNDKCVPHWWKCDGVNDCGDNSDELGCVPNATEAPETGGPIDISPEICLKNQYMCDNGRCISKSYVCDGFPDCTGGEDEINCPKTLCGRDKFRCRGDGVCLDRAKYCDGVVNCVDGSDEENCKQPQKP